LRAADVAAADVAVVAAAADEVSLAAAAGVMVAATDVVTAEVMAMAAVT
jgi:hypothetical protein